MLDLNSIHDEVSQKRGAARRTYREYYDGIHDTQLSDRQRAYLQLKTGQEFNDNYCPIVVDALAERLRVTGFSVAGVSDAEAKTQQEFLADWWAKNRMDALQKVTHTASVRDGDAYIVVEWSNEKGQPEFSFEPAWNGSEGVELHYSGEKRGVPEYASKIWKVAGGERLNLYYPDRTEKYRKNGETNDWELIGVENWTTAPTRLTVGKDIRVSSGEAIGIPVFGFKNRDQGYNYGQSELMNIIPLQNALNKSVIDMLAAADTTAFRIFTMIGDDPSGLSIVPGSWIYSEKGPDKISIGHIPGEDLTKLIEYKDTFVNEIARVSRTPLSYFQITHQVAAEGTQKQQESGLISRAEDRQIRFGNSWEDVMSMARRLWNVFGSVPVLDEENAIISAQWTTVESRNTKDMLEIATRKKSLGIPTEVIWQEMGYTEDEIKKMMGTDEYKAKMAALKASTMMGDFGNRGS